MQISFIKGYPLSNPALKLTQGTVGLYFIYLNSERILYPRLRSRLIYIGMSEAPSLSIGRRLAAHLAGESGNRGIENYAKFQGVSFTYHPIGTLKETGLKSIRDLESIFIARFQEDFGCFPICNGQSGRGLDLDNRFPDFLIDWSFFD